MNQNINPNINIELKDVVKSYHLKDHELPILRKLNFTISKPSIVSIVGQSGSGKTTLLSILAGLDTPDSGAVNYNGTIFNQLSEMERTKYRAQKISIIFQQFHLMPYLTALENVSLPLEILKNPEAKKLAEAALAKVGLGERFNHYPEELSGGECQRVAIARAFVTNPQIILADEPSGNLDERTGKMVMTELFEMVRKNNTTMILVTHNMELAKLTDQVYKLEAGELKPC